MLKVNISKRDNWEGPGEIPIDMMIIDTETDHHSFKHTFISSEDFLDFIEIFRNIGLDYDLDQINNTKRVNKSDLENMIESMKFVSKIHSTLIDQKMNEIKSTTDAIKELNNLIDKYKQEEVTNENRN